MGYGKHLVIDSCSECDRLGSTNFIFDLMNDLPELIGMEKITAPYVVPYKPNSKEWGGASEILVAKDKIRGVIVINGSIMIATSHLAVHTYPYTKPPYVFIDIFSCKDFDVKKILEILTQKLKLFNIKFQEIRRGEDFPLNSENGKINVKVDVQNNNSKIVGEVN